MSFKSQRILGILNSTKEMTARWIPLANKFKKLILRNDTQSQLQKLLSVVNRFPYLYDNQLNMTYDIFNQTSKEFQKYISKHNKTFFKYLNMSRPHVKGVIEFMITSNGTNKMVERLNAVIYLAKSWEALLAPMKFDIFYGFPNETSLNAYISNATKLTGQKRKTIMAAILFDNIENGSLPKHVFYRIRMDGRLMFSTQRVRSRYWKPGPMSGNTKYYYYGFTWIQDQLERGIIEVLTNKEVDNPGIYIQEMPYPCYLWDK